MNTICEKKNSAEKNFRVMMDKKAEHEPAFCSCSPEGQSYPGLHQEVIVSLY